VSLSPGRKSLERGSTFSADPKPLERRTPLAQVSPRRAEQDTARPRRSTLKAGTGFAASPAQRKKVAVQVCAVCQHDACDPAHLAPRAMGRGCDHPDCVIALCREHHEQFDKDELDLLPHLSGAGFEAELAHMQGHYSDPLSVVIRLSGCRWVPVQSEGVA
jgi:hypothetical protein